MMNKHLETKLQKVQILIDKSRKMEIDIKIGASQFLNQNKEGFFGACFSEECQPIYAQLQSFYTMC